MKKRKAGLLLGVAMCANVFAGCKAQEDDIEDVIVVESSMDISSSEQETIEEIKEETRPEKETEIQTIQSSETQEEIKEENKEEVTSGKYTDDNYMEAYKDYILGNYDKEDDLYDKLYSSDEVCFFPSGISVCDVNGDGYQDVIFYGMVGIRELIEGELCMWDGEKVNIYALDGEPSMYGNNMILFSSTDYTGAGDEYTGSTYVDAYQPDGTIKSIVISSVTEAYWDENGNEYDEPKLVSECYSVNGKDVSESEAEAKFDEVKANMKEIEFTDFTVDNISKLLK